MRKVGKASMVATGFVGTTMTGAVLGEVLIPIPFLGAFIGGVVGGYFAEKGTRSLNSALENKNTIKIISYLK